MGRLFGELARNRTGNGAENLALLRRMAFNLVRTEPSTIQPPPLSGMFKVPVSGSLFAWELGKVIRQT